MGNRIQEILIDCSSTILSALKQMDTVGKKLLIVTKDSLYFGLLSIGDIQRAIIKGVNMDNSISTIMRDKVRIATVHDDLNIVKKSMLERKSELMPIIDDEKKIVDVIFWDDLFDEKPRRMKSNLNLPVIIMAGGQGTRLRPLTNVLPKPLIPIGEQTMMEDIMDRFVECGCNRFYVSVNYKADFIKRYFDNLDKPQYQISYFQEEDRKSVV